METEVCTDEYKRRVELDHIPTGGFCSKPERRPESVWREPEGFSILRTAVPDMDRETQDQFLVLLQAKDMGGHLGGLSGTTTVTVRLTDVNDNPPRFAQSRVRLLPAAARRRSLLPGGGASCRAEERLITHAVRGSLASAMIDQLLLPAPLTSRRAAI
ncbi:Cadherin-24 [Liparis tanakae]|uniref:Cadherin-24 n=1 Tax=Liparis tanakae TaxID=230148 RepID=A0A4Z2FGV4_9TELE|nr:Cadherin-24 [Liparis tanakae]